MTILGIDPGLNKTGYAILEIVSQQCLLREGGIIKSNPEDSLATRVHEICSGIDEVIQEFQPSILAIEQIFSLGINPKSALMVAHVRGGVLTTALNRGVDVRHYSPTQVKKLLTGHGRANKEQIQHAIQTELKLAEILKPHDVADAAAIALCHIFSEQTQSKLQDIESSST